MTWLEIAGLAGSALATILIIGVAIVAADAFLRRLIP